MGALRILIFGFAGVLAICYLLLLGNSTVFSKVSAAFEFGNFYNGIRKNTLELLTFPGHYLISFMIKTGII